MYRGSMLRLEYHRLRLNRQKKGKGRGKKKKEKKKKKKGRGTGRHTVEKEKERRERKEKKRKNLESDGALERGVVISVQIARVRIRRSNGERNGGQTPSRWTLDGVRVHPRRCPRQLNKERKHTRGGKNIKKEKRPGK